MEALSDGGEDEHQLHHGKRIADAEPRAAAEREVGEPWQRLDRLLAPALRSETLGLGEEAWIALNDPLAHEHRRAAPHPIAADAAVGQRLAADHVGRRIK